MARTRIQTEEQAQALVAQIAEDNPYAVRKDIDALLEAGEVDMETIFGGYLWEAVEKAVPEMEEDENNLLADTIVEYWCEQMEGMYEEEDE